jgi:flagella basal body P-ring formation protein FlgA
MHRSPASFRPARAVRLFATVALALAMPFGFGPAARAQATNPAIPVDAAQPASIPSLGADLEQEVRQLALSGLQATANAGRGAAGVTPAGTPVAPRFEVSVGQLDARLRLAPCQHVEPYLPEGARLWGKARIGLRCTQGTSRWNVYLPVTVKAFGPALVANGNLPAGTVLASGDLVPAEVDLAEESSAPVLNPEFALGRVLARPLKAGQSLRQSHIKPRQWFAAGDAVTVIAQGAGFSVSGEGQALTNGIEGQPARVRTESGRVLTGQPVGERRVEMSL